MSEVVEGCGLVVCISLYIAHMYVHIGVHTHTHTHTKLGHLEDTSFPLTLLLLIVKDIANLIAPVSILMISNGPRVKT